MMRTDTTLAHVDRRSHAPRRRAAAPWRVAGAWVIAFLLPLGLPARELAYVAYTDGYWQVWAARLDGKHARQVTRSAYDKVKASWFPSGEELLVAGTGGELVRIRIDTETETQVRLPLEHGGDAVVSPDGTLIAYSAMNAASPDTNDVWVAEIDGNRARKVASLPALQHEPSWAPDGRTLFFVSGPGQQAHDIYRVDADGERLEQLTNGKLYHFDVSVARDGAMVFSANRGGNYDLWLRDAAGNESPLVESAAVESQPVWAPGEKEIFFTRVENGIPNLWRTARTGAKPVQVTRHTVGARNAAVRVRAPAARGRE
jgi:TolB protein